MIKTKSVVTKHKRLLFTIIISVGLVLLTAGFIYLKIRAKDIPLRTALSYILNNEDIPKSYEECNIRFPIKLDWRTKDHTLLYCSYFAQSNSPLYNKCMSAGGKTFDSVYIKCPGCGYEPSGCRLEYINPDFVLPINYAECQKVIPSEGGMSIYENDGKTYCSILVGVVNIFNKESADVLTKECISQGGKTQGDSCLLKFYEN